MRLLLAALLLSGCATITGLEDYEVGAAQGGGGQAGADHGGGGQGGGGGTGGQGGAAGAGGAQADCGTVQIPSECMSCGEDLGGCKYYCDYRPMPASLPCDAVCASMGLGCLDAYDDAGESCMTAEQLGCQNTTKPTVQCICATP